MADFPGGGFPERPTRQNGLPRFDLPNVSVTQLDRWARRGGWLVGVVLLLLLAGWAQSFYLDWLWFRGVGHEDVLLTSTLARVALYVAAVVAFLALAVPNLAYAWRATAGLPFLAEGVSPASYEVARKLLIRAAIAATGLLALMMAGPAAAQWETALLFLNRVPFGETEPIFGLDFGFFIFTLPALGLLRVWLLSAVVAVMLVVGGFYFLTTFYFCRHSWGTKT